MPEKGDIAFLSQSGAFGTAILDWAIGERIGFSKFISVGNKADVDETTLLEAVGADHDSRVLLGYIESIQRGEEFMRAAREITRRKPVILFKSGMTAAGAKAASSHTGALAGSDNAYAAAFRQSGILRAREVVDLFDWGLAFSYQKGIGGPNVALVTNAGGPGIIATDAVERSRLQMAAAEPRKPWTRCARRCRRRRTSTTRLTSSATRAPSATKSPSAPPSATRTSTASS